MKLAATVLALASVASASAASISAKTAQKLIRSGRRVEEEAAEEEEEEEEDEFAFLANYSVKMIGCKKELETPIVNEQGEYEYQAVLLRLCPADTCDSTSAAGCKGGYGDLLVGVETFVEAYLEDIKKQQEDEEEEEGDDDGFNMDEFGKCEEFNPDENADDANQGAWENYQFFVGPTCMDDELGIKMELFTDEYCSQVSEIDFATISNGWALPYSSGGLVSTYCSSGCTEYNDDGEMEIKEVCKKPYEESVLKCEAEMEYYSYYGQNVQGCESIAEMFPKAKASGGAIFGWFVLACVIVGLGGYIMWWRKKKATTIE